MTGLTGIFKVEQEEPQDNEKLVDLFRNRAELKKEFAALRNEKYQLQDRLKQQEGATARVQQKMDHLESLLLDREWVHNVVAFYQLRRLAAHCNVKLSRFAEQLKQQNEKKIHDRIQASFDEKQSGERGRIEAEIGEQRMQVQLLEDQLGSERHKAASMNGVAKMFKGKAKESEIDEISARLEVGRAREQKLMLALAELESMEPPPHEGLDVATKRSINFMILSYAQHLYLHFEEDRLAELAKESSEKSVGAINYGSKYECDELIERIEERWDTMESVTGYADVLKKRSKMISESAQFRSDDDVVPVSGSVATVISIDSNGVVKRKDASLLGDNYFGVAKVLSR